MLAVIDAYRRGLLKSHHWVSNIIAGAIVGIVALPLAMAFAIASGAKPEQGLYTAIIAAICVALFGGSRVQIAGPTAAFIVILAGIVAEYGMDGLQVATLMAGFILMLMGVTKLGTVVKFIPEPVIVGFTSGIAITIFVQQWSNFFGLAVKIPLDASFYQKLKLLIPALLHLNLVTTILACVSLITVILTPILLKRLPGPLIAILISIAILMGFHLHTVATLGSAFGGIPAALPFFHLPHITLHDIMILIGPAFTIALLGAIESLLSAAAADGMIGTRHDSNQELIGQGLANIFCPLFGGIAATGAIARTATNIRNGGTSPLAAIVHSGVLILFILLLAPYAKYIPLCALSAILFVVAYNIADFKHFFRMLQRAPRYDVIVLLATFLLTVFTNLVIAVNVGVILSILSFMYRMYQSVIIESKPLDKLLAELTPEGDISHFPAAKDVIVYDFQGPFFFGVAEKFEHVLSVTHTMPKVIIFRLHQVPFMDMTGIQTFHEVIKNLREQGVEVYVCGANDRILRKLIKNDVVAGLAEKKIFQSVEETLCYLQADFQLPTN